MQYKCTEFPIPSFIEVFRLSFREFPGLWAATAARYCPSRAGELPKQNMTKSHERWDGKLCRFQNLSVSTSFQTETVSVWFRPEILACFGFGISGFSLFGVSAETLFLAETACFGWNTLFRPILDAHFTIKSTAKTSFYGRNKVFRPKQAISAKKVYRPKFRFQPKFRLFPGALFRFRCFGQKYVSFDHYF